MSESPPRLDARPCIAHRWLWLAIALSGVGCADATPEDPYAQWSNTQPAGEIERYQQFLQRQGVGDVVPMRSLLRSARRWRPCGADEFALPPRSHWAAQVPTLRVVRDLQAAGLLDPARVASGYRDAGLNRCAGGSSRSRHLANNALDFDLAPSPDNVARLCAYWRRQGPTARLGLGFYTDTKIHLDTAGFRTWGEDHTRRTSLCTSGAAR